jgi:hypothetical protein
MQRTGATETAANVLRKVFPAVLLLCLAVSGCGTTCVSGIFNGNTGSVGVSNISCPLTKAMGAVTVQISVASASSADSAVFPPPLATPRASPGNVQHIFVTLRGIEAHSDVVADEDSPAWQELAPDLSAHPVQVDLLASSSPSASLTLTGDSSSLGSPADAIVPAMLPADEYRQTRFWLLPRNPSPDDPVPESNACGDVGWNCIVFADRSTRPLEFPHSEFAAASVRQLGFGPAPQFHIPLEHGAASLFRLLPGDVIHLSIEFDAASSVYFASDAAVYLVPVFRVVSRRSSPAP